LNVSIFLRLGRVSNLPTVWTDTLAGVALAGAWPPDGRLIPLLVAMTLAYTGGMFLNDLFDREIDARERPERPIPSGAVAPGTVRAYGFGMLGAAVLLVAWCAFGGEGSGVRATLAALALVAAIVGYDLRHKGNPLGPLLMGLCRMLVYVTVGFALLPAPAPALFVGAVVLLAYLIGLTWTAKQENLGPIESLWPLAPLAAPVVYGIVVATTGNPLAWLPSVVLALWLLAMLRLVRRRAPGDMPRAVGGMIAGIALVDAIFLATVAGPLPTLLVGAAFALTLALQRRVPGT